jgi:nitric oxide dioxygenase
MMKNILDMIEYPKEGILSKEITKGKINVTLFCMAKGTEMLEHTSTKQGTIYVIEGDGIFKLSGKDIEMKQGIIIYMKENETHSIKTDENTSFILTLI